MGFAVLDNKTGLIMENANPDKLKIYTYKDAEWPSIREWFCQAQDIKASERTLAYFETFGLKNIEFLSCLNFLERKGWLPQIPQKILSLDSPRRHILLQLLILQRQMTYLRNAHNSNYSYISREIKMNRCLQLNIAVWKPLCEPENEADSLLGEDLIDYLIESLTPNVFINSHYVSLLIQELMMNRKKQRENLRAYSHALRMVNAGELYLTGELLFLISTFGCEFKPYVTIDPTIFNNILEFRLSFQNSQKIEQSFLLSTTEKDYSVISLASLAAIEEEGKYQNNCLTKPESFFENIYHGRISLYSLRSGQKRVTIRLGRIGNIEDCYGHNNSVADIDASKLTVKKNPIFKPSIEDMERIKNELRKIILETSQNKEKCLAHIEELGSDDIFFLRDSYNMFKRINCFYFTPYMEIEQQGFQQTLKVNSLYSAFEIKFRPPLFDPKSIHLILHDNNKTVALLSYDRDLNKAPLLKKIWKKTNKWEVKRVIKSLRNFKCVEHGILLQKIIADMKINEELPQHFWIHIAQLLAGTKSHASESVETKEQLPDQAKTTSQIESLRQLFVENNDTVFQFCKLLEKNRAFPPLPAFLTKKYLDNFSKILFPYFLANHLTALSKLSNTINNGKTISFELILPVTKEKLIIKITDTPFLKKTMELSKGDILITHYNLLNWTVNRIFPINRKIWEQLIIHIIDNPIVLKRLAAFQKRIYSIPDIQGDTFREHVFMIVFLGVRFSKIGSISTMTFHRFLNAITCPEETIIRRMKYRLSLDQKGPIVFPLNTLSLLRIESPLGSSRCLKDFVDALLGEKSFYGIRMEGKSLFVEIDTAGNILDDSTAQELNFLGLKVERDPHFTSSTACSFKKKEIPTEILYLIRNKKHFMQKSLEMSRFELNTLWNLYQSTNSSDLIGNSEFISEKRGEKNVILWKGLLEIEW
jgi:hypothetical protein